MPSFLFWNVAKNRSAFPHLVRLVSSTNCDVILIAECPENLDDLVVELNSKGERIFREETIGDAKVRVVTSLPLSVFFPKYVNAPKDMAIWHFRTDRSDIPVVQFVYVHLLSKISASDEAQTANSIAVSGELARYEDKHDCHDTVVIGDMNMNPYDPGLIQISGFHAEMTEELARKPRKWRGEPYRKFYNPMWGFFGDRTPGPPGSYYYSPSTDDNHKWQILDHVLLRPSLIKCLEQLEILVTDGKEVLTNEDGVPTKEHVSDHLPIFCQLKF